jgi:DNA-binding Lrp family transcriptional regulator
MKKSRSLMKLKALLAERLQSGLPLTERPYEAVASELECDEATVLALTNELILEGYIRSFGAFVDFERLGYQWLLCGLVVPDEAIRPLTERLNRQREVTHNYLRDHTVNLWFTALVEADGRNDFIDKILRARKYPFVVLTTKTRLKLRPTFSFSHNEDPDLAKLASVAQKSAPDVLEEEYSPDEAPVAAMDEKTIKVISLLQDNFPIVSSPFDIAADMWGCSVPQLLKLLDSLKTIRVLRRIGASLHHRRMGYQANALVAWNTAADVREAGKWAASLPWVSHVYVRKAIENTLPFAWPYSLYTMLHAVDEASLSKRVRFMKNVLGEDSAVLSTVRELKKTRYHLKS